MTAPGGPGLLVATLFKLVSGIDRQKLQKTYIHENEINRTLYLFFRSAPPVLTIKVNRRVNVRPSRRRTNNFIYLFLFSVDGHR